MWMMSANPMLSPMGASGTDDREVSMSKEPRCPYASFKNDRERLWALVSRDLRMVAISMLCAAATGGGDALRELVALWL